MCVECKYYRATLGQKSTFYPEITKNLMCENCEFCEKWDFRKVNFVKVGISMCDFLDKMWIFAPVCRARLHLQCLYSLEKG